MKILWLDLNSSYAHSSLALPALHAQIADKKEMEWDIVSSTINENVGMIVNEIAARQPDIVAATAWLFNHEQLLHILSRVKALLPHCVIALGGPEFWEIMKSSSEETDLYPVCLEVKEKSLYPCGYPAVIIGSSGAALRDCVT